MRCRSPLSRSASVLFLGAILIAGSVAGKYFVEYAEGRYPAWADSRNILTAFGLQVLPFLSVLAAAVFLAVCFVYLPERPGVPWILAGLAMVACGVTALRWHPPYITMMYGLKDFADSSIDADVIRQWRATRADAEDNFLEIEQWPTAIRDLSPNRLEATILTGNHPVTRVGWGGGFLQWRGIVVGPKELTAEDIPVPEDEGYVLFVKEGVFVWYGG